MNQVLFKPNEPMASFMARQTQLVTSISAAESAWQKLHKPVVFDGLFTIPTYIAHFQRTSALTLWSQQYGAMYMRIAEELRRQRIELSNMLDSIKRLPQIEELEQLMFEHEGVCNYANSVHKRLCEIEKVTCSRSFSNLGFVDEFVAELRLDHAVMDDSLTRIGEIPTSQLMGQNELVARTWYRVRLFSTELKRIDNDLNWLVQQIFA